MKITDLLHKESILLGASVADKAEAYDKLVDLMDASGNLSDKEEYKKGIYAREEQGPTAIGSGISIPHSKNAAVKAPGLASMTVPAGVDCDALDGDVSNLFFMIAAPAEGSDVHLQVLSRLSMLLMDEEFRKKLLAAKDKEEYLSIIDAKEKEKFPEEEEATAQVPVANEEKKEGYRILAVTACPTGIAHTFMAAEALEMAGEKMGYPLKAETNGSGGVKNRLTKEEIEACDGIIVAADKKVEMARFEGKPVIQVKVADGIHKPEELIQKIIDKDAPIYHHDGEGAKEEEGGEESLGRSIYKNLMNGVSHMLPFVIGGGILIAIAFMLDDYSIDPSNFGMNTPIAAFFKTVGGTAFNFMLPILAGYIAMSIADRPGLAVGFVGGALASSGMTFANPAGGVSPGFLGALFAGFAAGYLVLGLKKIADKVLPDSLEGLKPMLIYPVAGILLIGVIMCLVNPLIAMVNTGLNNFLSSLNGSSRIVLGAILGGMMAIDMGGPFNKAAYVFGTASIASANYHIMAAVMMGGMVPPIGIALASLVFKNKFTKKDRDAAPVNFIMGLSFITEGAIPFAAADPIRVIPSCMIGSAVAGALSMLFGCELMAPHGGMWVIAVISHRIGYLAALVVGSLITALLLGILKKPVEE
ncbi:MAG: fructose-specific PTS transporter subunit EIIC [Eubacterium sp.]|nr:fructose-specific PTS transporter subunit EIIC [Eubacterium sp.]